jgi:putative endonuclease
LSGLSAEDAVADLYDRSGCEVIEQRWRGLAGEVDLICRDGDTLIFVEVKAAACLDRAACHLTPSQISRIMSAAEEYAGCQPAGLLTPIRLDAALVDGQGRIEVIENISLL